MLKDIAAWNCYIESRALRPHHAICKSRRGIAALQQAHGCTSDQAIPCPTQVGNERRQGRHVRQAHVCTAQVAQHRAGWAQGQHDVLHASLQYGESRSSPGMLSLQLEMTDFDVDLVSEEQASSHSRLCAPM